MQKEIGCQRAIVPDEASFITAVTLPVDGGQSGRIG